LVTLYCFPPVAMTAYMCYSDAILKKVANSSGCREARQCL